MNAELLLNSGGALVHAAPLSELVAGVVAYYPSITKLPSLSQVATQVAVPTLLLRGEKDNYFGCCLAAQVACRQTYFSSSDQARR